LQRVTDGGEETNKILQDSRSRCPRNLMFNSLIIQDTSKGMEEKDIQKETLKPITKVNSKLDMELQEWEVESTKGGGDLNQ
jgi:hypothetical protein